MRGLAIIPTIWESEFLGALKWQLLGEDIRVLMVCNHPDSNKGTWDNLSVPSETIANRPGWSIYRTWNFGMRLGAYLKVPTLILNDDIILNPGAATKMCDELAKGEWAVLGFDYKPGWWRNGPTPTNGTYRHGGVGGFAFGVNPRLCARVDRRFRWWGGDDDLMFATRDAGGKVGILGGAIVQHPRPSLSATARPDLLPEGWAENDRGLLVSKWNAGW